MSLRYPSWQGIGVDSGAIMDAFDSGFDRSRQQRYEREFAEMAPRLLGIGQQQQPMSLAALGQQIQQPVAQQIQTYTPPQKSDPATQRIQSAMGETGDREAQAMQFFIGKGYTPHQAAGIVGNLIQESNLNTGAINRGDGRDGSDSIGIGQWNGPRAQALQAFAQQSGVDPSDFNTQLAFVDHELNGSEKGVLERLRAAKNPIEATAAFVGYERPQGWTADNPYNAHGWGNRAKHAARLAGGSYAPQQVMPAQQQVADASGQFPEPQNNSVFDDVDFMRRAFANPMTRDLAIAAAQSRNDPTKRLQFEKATLELEKLRQEIGRGPERKTTTIDGRLIDSQTGQVIAEYDQRQKPTSDMQEYEFAREQGFKGSFVDFQLAQKKAGATSITNNVGEGDKFYENLDKKNAEMFSALSDEGVRARSKAAQIDRLDGLLQNAPQGIGAMLKQAAGEYGINTEGLSDIQAAQALINELVPQQRQPGSGPMSDADLALFKQSLPRLINQPGGNQTIINTMRGITEYQVKMGEIADAVADRTMTPQQGRAAIRNLQNPLANFGKSGGGTASPKAGSIVDGYRFKGGNPADQSSWERVR